MATAIWIIAICEVIRVMQYVYDIWMRKQMLKNNSTLLDKAYEKYAKSIEQTDEKTKTFWEEAMDKLGQKEE